MSGADVRYIALHTAAAAVFVFVLNRYALGGTTEASLIWAAGFGAIAAGLAWKQTQSSERKRL